jgi:beta-glucosidase/6-phospho-beta-glucosidase/beta-galactosidase
MSREESVRDAYRQKYLSDHLDAITGAIQDGVKVSGYFVWSLMDNFGEYSQILPLLRTIFSS